MSIELIRDALFWCTVLNYTLLLFWALAFMSARDWMHDLHARWFRLPVEQFDAIHYAGMAVYKIGIFLMNLVPLVALHIVG